MVRSFLAMGAAALLALVVLTDGARAGDCAGCGTVLASPQASEQTYAAPQGGCYAPTVCEEKAGCDILGKLHGFKDGVGCKLHGLKSGLCCKLDSVKCGVGNVCGGIKCGLHDKIGGLKCKLASLKCKKAEPTCYSPCAVPTEQCATPSPQGIVAPAPQAIAAPQVIAAPAGQFPSAQ